MERNYFKLVFYGLGAMLIATSCLKTEELDSVKALRDAKTAQINAQTDALNLENAYDSANYLIMLATNKAASDYQKSNNEFTLYKSKMNFKTDSANAAYTSATNKAISDYQVAYQKAQADYQTAYQKAYADYQVAYYAGQASQQAAITKAYEAQQAAEVAKYNKTVAVLASTQAAEIAYQELNLATWQKQEQDQIIAQQQAIATAKNTLLTTQATFYTNQVALNAAIIAAQKDSINNSLKNPLLVTLYNDYFTYYNGSATPLSSGVTIAAGNGIFGLRQQILTDQDKLLTNASYKIAKEDLIKTNADLKLAKLAAIRTDSIDIVAYNELIAVYTNAKTAANYNTSIAAIENLMTTAAANVTSTEMTKTNEQEKLDELTNIYTIANTAYTTAVTAFTNNTTAKNTADAAMTTLLGTYTYTTFDQLQTESTRLTTQVNADNQEVSAWMTKYSTALAALNTAATAMNSTQVSRDAALATYNASVAANDAPGVQAAYLIDYNNKQTAFNTAQTTWTSKNTEYNAVLTGFDAAKAALKASQTALQNVTDDITDYNKDLADYNKAVAKETTLAADRDTKKTDMETKLAAKDAQNLISIAATLAHTNALSTYNTYAAGKTALEALQATGTTVNLSALDNEIFKNQQLIENENNDIADLKLQIARINDGSFKIDDDIALLTDQVAYNEALLADYEAKAAAVKAQIDDIE